MRKNGKQICEYLKHIRQSIAKENDIALEQSECKHEGECEGTCPRCEQEVAYLASELTARQRLGKAVSIVGLAAGVSAAALSSCRSMKGEPAVELMGDVIVEMPDSTNNPTGEAEQAPLLFPDD